MSADSAPASAIVTAVPGITPSTTFYRSYDLNRRVRLTRSLANFFRYFSLVFLVLLTFSLVVGPRAGSAKPIFGVLFGLGAASHLCYQLSLAAGKRGWLNGAIGLLLSGIAINYFGVNLTWNLFTGINAISLVGLMTLSTIIVFAGLIGEPRTIIGTTLAMMAFTCLMFAVVPKAGVIADYLFVIAPLLLSSQVGVMLLMIIAWNINQRTVIDLTETQQAFAQTKQLEELKDLFISSVNHELRTPLMTMKGYIELMAMTDATLTPERRQTLLRRANAVGDHLVGLVNSVLEIRQIEGVSSDFTPERVGIRAAVVNAAQMINPLEAQDTERELRLDIPEALEVWADQTHILQIFTNLISNAIKYSPAGSPIDVAAQVITAPMAGGKRRRNAPIAALPMVEIRVRDYGLGIPPDQIPLLFNRFVRLPRDLASNVLGNGLGLFLCRRLVENMHGKIWVESTGALGEGATFCFRLPAPPSDAVDMPSLSAAIPSGA